MENRNSQPEGKELTQERLMKKPYIKPGFRFERVFVTTALTCGKTGHETFHCRVNHKVS